MKHVVLLSESIGCGHESAASAIEEALAKEFGDVKITRVNMLDTFQPLIAKFIKGIYIQMLKSTPVIWGAWYEYKRNKEWSGIVPKIIIGMLQKSVQKWLTAMKADVVVCTHPLSSFLIAELKERGMEIPLCTVLTDFDLHGYWMHPKVDLYCVPVREMETVIKKYNRKTSIKVTGIPVSGKFSEEVIKQKEQMHQRKKILIMGGGLGIGVLPMIETAMETSSLAEFTIVTGNNKRLYKKLKEKYEGYENIKILGYINHIQTLMAESDLLITKPGGLTLSEALVMKLPMVLYMPIRGQERRNGKLMESLKVALVSEELEEMKEKLASLMTNDSNLFKMERTMNRIRKPEAAKTIAKEIMKLTELKRLPL
jgi:processive 1,2-diacylglycerol beta-glucosyltransferase